MLRNLCKKGIIHWMRRLWPSVNTKYCPPVTRQIIPNSSTSTWVLAPSRWSIHDTDSPNEGIWQRKVPPIDSVACPMVPQGHCSWARIKHRADIIVSIFHCLLKLLNLILEIFRHQSCDCSQIRMQRIRLLNETWLSALAYSWSQYESLPITCLSCEHQCVAVIIFRWAFSTICSAPNCPQY